MSDIRIIGDPPDAEPITKTLTPADFEAVHYGSPVTSLGEHGEWLLILGHPGRRRAWAVFNRHIRTHLGERHGLTDWWGRPHRDWNQFLTEEWVVIRPDEDDGEDQGGWCADWDGGKDAPGAVPVTVLDVG
ncbi:hypothetical protein SRB5_51580 [Streptomyces sp. RB5]|uniref:Uncharacterized protein n=1 Tax=Streptomyces smaragdinus TaxID=2585196 RepID=A0A7K0CNI8_9ACTN|nr:hypothetical protein [Streptomyces smaragdinus]MQY14981.1 hypothetical protein [Streptomyces smaragdinus]